MLSQIQGLVFQYFTEDWELCVSYYSDHHTFNMSSKASTWWYLSVYLSTSFILGPSTRQPFLSFSEGTDFERPGGGSLDLWLTSGPGGHAGLCLKVPVNSLWFPSGSSGAWHPPVPQLTGLVVIWVLPHSVPLLWNYMDSSKPPAKPAPPGSTCPSQQGASYGVDC